MVHFFDQPPRDDVQPLEVFVAVGTLLRGVWLFPVDVYSFAPTLYRYIGLGPQQIWGGLSLTIGLIALFASFRCPNRIRIWTNYMMMFYWWSVAALFLMSNVNATLFWTFSLWIGLQPMRVISRLAAHKSI